MSNQIQYDKTKASTSVRLGGALKIKEEKKIAVFIILGIFSIATIVKILFFSEQSFLWHIGTSLIGLFFLTFFGFTVRAIDIALDRKFPFEKNVAKRIFLQFIITLFVLVAIRLLSVPLIIKILPVTFSKEIWVASFVINIFMVLSLILSIFGYHFFVRWKAEKILATELEKEKAQVQYDNLKNQLNPHFLFNALSSLNSLIFENPQLASDFLQQLSKVYRYVLENKEKNAVSLQTEIDFVSHYVKLLETRFGDGLKVIFEVSDDVKEKMIVPVTLQILIENAAKHNTTSKDSPLVIRIKNDGDYLSIENNLQKKNAIEISNKHGLENLKNLYHYISENKVAVIETSNSFDVRIPLT